MRGGGASKVEPGGAIICSNTTATWRGRKVAIELRECLPDGMVRSRKGRATTTTCKERRKESNNSSEKETTSINGEHSRDSGAREGEEQ
ncbi:hypothetical protein CDL15_Pgr004648 [Punica granatum]|uniref:Uncharacterized protein n=1 Tax=Punica granatum TaxID=22663 RepID=A0A218WPF0_PUNGR|nr:hypothetical protein CDL15_Pgr004648 [Punica granatum]